MAGWPSPPPVSPMEANGLDGADLRRAPFAERRLRRNVAKQAHGGYVQGERAKVTVKHRQTVDMVIGGYRLHKQGDRAGSPLLGRYTDGGRLHFIGHCSGFGDADRVALLAPLREHEAPESFGAGARRPGEPSRWSGDSRLAWLPVLADVACEVSYDELTGDRFRHATRFQRWRPDKEPVESTRDQLERPDGPALADIVVT